MSYYEIFALSAALAMDAFAVAISIGFKLKTVDYHQKFRLSWHFGLFQALMPVIGWSAGLSVRNIIEAYDHWIAFILLLFIGLKMIKEAFEKNKPERIKDPSKGISLVVLSIVTSIDALAVGFSLSILEISIWEPAVIIGIVAGIFTFTGLYIGKTVVRVVYLNRYAELAGGIVLVGIGLRILWSHGVFSNITAFS